MYYQKKPVVIEAEQYSSQEPGPLIAEAITSTDAYVEASGALIIRTLEGNHIANPGDWIIKGVKGEFYPCKPDIFAMTYESVKSEGLSFSKAIAAMKEGHRVARAGWNGKGMWIAISGSKRALMKVVTESFWQKYRKPTSEELAKDPINELPFVMMWTATNEVLSGWLASQTDMLADDWMVLPEDAQ